MRAHLEVWEGIPEDSEPMMAMLRAAITNEQAGAQKSSGADCSTYEKKKSRGCARGTGRCRCCFAIVRAAACLSVLPSGRGHIPSRLSLPSSPAIQSELV